MTPSLLLHRTLDTLIPPVCPLTGIEVGATGALSPHAWHELSFIATPGCRRCGREVPEVQPPDADFVCDTCRAYAHGWDRGRAAFAYEGTGRQLILALKHGDRLDLVPLLATWMRRVATPLIDKADLVIPIPLHWTRRIARRYNQSAELARVLSAQAGKPAAFDPFCLLRPRHTPKQDGLDRAGRIANLKDSLTATRRGQRRLPGARVLLVDDVMTTGATLDAATRVCLAAGASSVDVVVSALVNFDRAPYVAAVTDPEDIADATD